MAKRKHFNFFNRKRYNVRYAVDRLEGDYVVLENLENGELVEVEMSLLEDVREGDIFVYMDGKYKKDDDFRRERLANIREKMEKLKRKGV